jgi:hypothetical protein
MKKQSFFAFLAIALLFTTGSAFATCPTPYAGPYYLGPYTYADYTQDQSCYYSSGNMSSTSISCFSEPSWSIGSGGGYVSTSFTIGSSDWVGNPNNWSISSWIDASSPGGTAADHFEIDIDVVHPNNSVSYYTMLFWNGLMGSLSSCSGAHYTTFSANVGDTIIVTVGGANSGSANIVVSRPRIFSQSP